MANNSKTNSKSKTNTAKKVKPSKEKDSVIDEILNMEVPTPSKTEEAKDVVEKEVVESVNPTEINEPFATTDNVANEIVDTEMIDADIKEEIEEEKPIEEDSETLDLTGLSDKEVAEIIQQLPDDAEIEVILDKDEQTVEQAEVKKEEPKQPKRRKTAFEAYGYGIGGWRYDD